MTTQETPNGVITPGGRVHCGQCGGELKLYTTDEGTPAPSHRDGCWRAYCEGCGATGAVRAATVEGRMELGDRLPKATIKLDPMDAGRAQLGLAGSRR